MDDFTKVSFRAPTGSGPGLSGSGAPGTLARAQTGPAPEFERQALDAAIDRAVRAALADQRGDGHWCYELEADCTIPSEYVLYMHFMDEVDPVLEAKLARYIAEHQQADGGWPLYHGGQSELSCSVKAYFALKLAGANPDSPRLTRARQFILAAGGAERANVFTRIMLATFGQIPWRGAPYMPVEIMLLPRWFFFHLDKVSYWSRTVMVPLFILFSLNARAAKPRNVCVPELFATPPDRVSDWFPSRTRLSRLFLRLDRLGRRIEPFIPAELRRRAIGRAEAWFVERLNGEDGLGAIFPAMANATMALKLLGYPADHPHRIQARNALRKLVVEGEHTAYCQPCVSPVWDTALMALTLIETGDRAARDPAQRGLDWLAERQVTDHPGDWRRHRPQLPGGGWTFQYGNPHYPDLDDTPVVAWAMQAFDPQRYRQVIDRAVHWLAGMQSRNGGFAAFDVDNTREYLNEIPFADHDALLDPPTADVSARCLTLFAHLGTEELAPVRARCLEWLMREQEASGAWFERWGTNFIYGTWSVLVALGADPATRARPEVERAVSWLKSCQRADGGWGEGNDSYFDPALAGRAHSSRAFQTAWAVLGLIAVGQAHSDAVAGGVRFLIETQASSGFWHEPWFNAPGFPRVFHLKYHGYSRYFPLWALAAYRRART